MHAPGSSEEHGGLDPAELKRYALSAEGLIDFSVNSNPFGPAPAVQAAIRRVDIAAYPDRQSGALTEALAAANQVDRKAILVGNGAAELIWLTVQAFLRPGERVIILGPTFGEYRRAVQALGGQINEVRASAPAFRPPVEALLEAIASDPPRLVFVCNPNNPTGIHLSAPVIERLAAACGEGALLVLDEAYHAFRDGHFFATPPPANCLVLRSMTKDFALAGLRLGYALGHPDQIARLAHFQPAWSVNAVAQAAGLAALAELDYYHRTLRELGILKEDFFSQLSACRFAPVPSDAHFGVIPVGCSARQIRHRLLQRSIQVRDCASFGLPQHIRVSTRQATDNLRLIQALKEIGIAG